MENMKHHLFYLTHFTPKMFYYLLTVINSFTLNKYLDSYFIQHLNMGKSKYTLTYLKSEQNNAYIIGNEEKE